MKKPKFRYCRRGKQLQLKIATDLEIKETCFLQPVCSISDRNKATAEIFDCWILLKNSALSKD